MVWVECAFSTLPFYLAVTAIVWSSFHSLVGGSQKISANSKQLD